jgi:hypothetical protein
MEHQNLVIIKRIKYSRVRERGLSDLLLVAIVLLVIVIVLLIHEFCFPVPPKKPNPVPVPIESSNANLVRGYLAVTVGNSDKAKSEGIYSQSIEGKDVYIPGLKVYLKDSKTGKRSQLTHSDLSGRFSLYAPGKGNYSLCWESGGYDSGCTAAFISAGLAPQFLSTVNIKVPHKQGYVAIMGHVTLGDGSLPRTLEPLMNINSFAKVELDKVEPDDDDIDHLTNAYVNNFGDYLLPYVPIKQRISLNASIELDKFVQEIRPDAQIEVAALNQVNLKFENHRPHINPLGAFDLINNRRVQNATPGLEMGIQAKVQDKDGDPIKFAWFVDSNEGKLSQTTGSSVKWKIPTAPGRYTVTVVAYDSKGGYDKAVLSVLANDKGVPFTGVIVEPNGTPIKDAVIEIVGNPVVKTDNNGRFQTQIKEADRYVFNVHKEGYALNSKVYDRAQTGGRWILQSGQVVTIDPNVGGTITHKRPESGCPGPDSTNAGLGAAGDSLTIPQWQDGNGNAVDAPPWWNGPRSVGELGKQVVLRTHATASASTSERQPVILPRALDLPLCGPGVTVEIPPGAILDASGNPATTPFNATIATIDPLSPQQMPGDDSVLPIGGGGGFLQSFGAGSLDLPFGFTLKPGTEAKITIPVDRSRRALGSGLPATVPLLSYDEQKGLWVEENTLALTTVNGVQAYVGKVKHFTDYNADTFFTNAACLRVFSPTLPGNYNLEVMSPYPDGTPHYKNYPIDNTSSTEHVIYNITPNANMTLAPMTQGTNPQLLGFYIVNSGPPQNPSNSPNVPPLTPQGYTSCQNFVVLKAGNAPDSSFGGEFLHSLGFIDAANLGFDDLTSAGPTGNVLRDAIVAASRNYYNSIDPTHLRTTFADFKSHNLFSADPNTPSAGETVAQYANSGDLGFGRDMHCRKNGVNVACYVTNYGTGYTSVAPGGGTDDHDDANAAGQRSTVVNPVTGNSAEVATVAMEYSPIENDPVADKVVKFYVYKKNFPNPGDYGLSISANLDGRGERPVPQLCMICHGGLIPNQSGGVPVFGAPAQVKLDARFLPFDHRFFTFPTSPALSKANQEAKFKTLNEQIVNATSPIAANDPIREVVNGLYNNGVSGSQILNFTVPSWVNGTSAGAANQADFYQKIIANDCRTCHIAQKFAQLQFNTSDKFINLAQFNPGTVGGATNRLMLGTAQSRVCGDFTMPHALRTHDIFWDVYWDVPSWGVPPTPAHQVFQTFGDSVVSVGASSPWKPALCNSFISGLVSTPSQFYEQTIQSIWNSKCVACHVVGGQATFLPLTEGSSYGGLVPGRVVPNDDNPTTPGNTLLQRTTANAPGNRMPPNCFRAPEPPNGNLPCLPQVDIDKIKAWIRSGAN